MLTGPLYLEVYRSGHNGPDSKSGSPQGLVGSNPTASAISKATICCVIFTRQHTVAFKI